MAKYQFLTILFLLLTLFLFYVHFGYFILEKTFFSRYDFKLGLDLKGGAHLVYKADLTNIPEAEKGEALAGLRDVIERRINLFGVAEPIVQVEKKENEGRLIAEIAGVYNTEQAIKMLGETPYLEFKTQRDATTTADILEAQKQGTRLTEDPYFIPTLLTGRFLKKAVLDFNPTTFEPEVSLEFNDEGAKMFEKMTEENIGKSIAIYLDAGPISVPVVREKISGGKAQITGKFTPKEAKELVRRLNSGALPIPIALISQETVGPTLGESSIKASIKAGLIGLTLLIVFMILYYRLLGLIAVFALLFYGVAVLTLFKFIPVTLTLPGLVGFIMSLGMAVDANILIFSRTKEESRLGKTFNIAIEEGFRRAWSAIRDSNITTILVALVLFWFGTSAIKGFALVLMLGVATSMLSAIWVTKIYLKALPFNKIESYKKLIGV